MGRVVWVNEGRNERTRDPALIAAFGKYSCLGPSLAISSGPLVEVCRFAELCSLVHIRARLPPYLNFGDNDLTSSRRKLQSSRS